MLTFAEELWPNVEAEVRAITPAHWDELAVFQKEIPLDIDWAHYSAIAERGNLHVMTVRAGTRLVGYYISVINTHPHYKGTLFGFLDCYFLLPEFRSPAMGVKFFDEFERLMRERGVRCLISSTKTHHDVGPLFRRLGWQHVGATYSKLLEVV